MNLLIVIVNYRSAQLAIDCLRVCGEVGSSDSERVTARMLLAQVSASGAVNKIFAAYTKTYSGLPQEGAVTTPCQVLSTDATGQNTLATCPAFGRIDNGAFTRLVRSSDDFGAAW